MSALNPSLLKPLQRIKASEFALRLNADLTTQDKRYAFFLGSGCSVSSGIKTAGGLVDDEWLPKLRDVMAPDQADHKAWATRELNSEPIKYDPDFPSASYGTLMKRLFLNKEEQQREIERLCDNKFPAFGYSVLAELMERAKSDGTFNVVLTTNFDDLVADALYLFTSIRPLVIHHESLAGYIRPTRTRPLIIKLHGDNHLSPYNTPEQTASLPDKTNRQVRNLLHDRGLIFLGYSGNDQSILRLLEALPEDALPLGIYWCSQDEPNCQLSEWLSKREAVWVQSPHFDEFMLLIHAAMDLGHPKPKRFEDVFEKRMETYKVLTGHIVESPVDTAEQAALKAAVIKTDKSFPDWQSVVIEAYRLGDTNPAEAEEIYKDGLERFPISPEIASTYAIFLKDKRRFDEAEKYHIISFNINPTYFYNLFSYGLLLKRLKRYSEAEYYYRRALELNSSDSSLLGNLGLLLNESNRPVEADIYYKKSIEIDPSNVNNLTNYGIFLSDTKSKESDFYHKIAIDTDPNNAVSHFGYAISLFKQNRNEEAEEQFKVAIKLDSKATSFLYHYGILLSKQERFNEAELYYKLAIESDGADANALGSYANFLKHQNRSQEAEHFYKKAINLDSKNPLVISNYAILLTQLRRHQEAEKYYEQALNLNPSHSNSLGNYAQLILVKNPALGLTFLDRAHTTVTDKTAADLILELNFYELAHRLPLGNTLPISKLKRMIIKGKHSKGWDFSLNINRAKQDNHPFAEWLPVLAAVITDEAPLSALDEWPEWQQAES